MVGGSTLLLNFGAKFQRWVINFGYPNYASQMIWYFHDRTSVHPSFRPHHSEMLFLSGDSSLSFNMSLDFDVKLNWQLPETGYSLTSIKWPYHGPRCQLIFFLSFPLTGFSLLINHWLRLESFKSLVLEICLHNKRFSVALKRTVLKTSEVLKFKVKCLFPSSEVDWRRLPYTLF